MRAGGNGVTREEREVMAGGAWAGGYRRRARYSHAYAIPGSARTASW